jgi:hypothetical protein
VQVSKQRRRERERYWKELADSELSFWVVLASLSEHPYLMAYAKGMELEVVEKLVSLAEEVFA